MSFTQSELTAYVPTLFMVIFKPLCYCKNALKRAKFLNSSKKLQWYKVSQWHCCCLKQLVFLWNCTACRKTSCSECPHSLSFLLWMALCALWVIFVLGCTACIRTLEDQENWIPLVFYSGCVCGCIYSVVWAARFVPLWHVSCSASLHMRSMSNYPAMLKQTQLHYCTLSETMWHWYCSLDPACVVWDFHPPGFRCYPFVSQDAAGPSHYSSHTWDLCCCLMFHGCIKGDESGSQWLERETGSDRGKNKKIRENKREGLRVHWCPKHDALLIKWKLFICQ